MTHLNCPFCGRRALEEFTFLKTSWPASGDPVADVYLRAEEPQLSLEHWQHVQGCRTWLIVRRNPSTGEVLSVATLGEDAP